MLRSEHEYFYIKLAFMSKMAKKANGMSVKNKTQPCAKDHKK